jgi:hypothetical protein
MTDIDRLKYLRIALVVVGLTFAVGLYVLMIGWPSLWPAGWVWHSGHSHYPMMIVGVYATLGVFLIRAAWNPLENLSLIWFTVWSSAVHGAIMTVQAIVDPMSRGHLVGDVPGLFAFAIALAILTPRRGTVVSAKAAAPSSGASAPPAPVMARKAAV